MVITPQQFAAFSPHNGIAPATIHALCGDGDGTGSHLAQTLEAHGMTEPGIAAQFLAACHLASKGFVSFVVPHAADAKRVEFQWPESWVEARACDWTTWNLNSDAREWDFNVIVDHFARSFEFTRSYPEIWRVLNRVCRALGVEDQSEEFALQD
ncbi:MAG: hypothetical protein EBS50_13135 [Sphingomonadaceae bacterium]|nr:hypothetical protein [Sphingomonadaceae bacterium]